MPNRQLCKLYLLSRALVRLVVALVTQVAAVILLHLLAPPPTFCGQGRA
jgi:hypothetical protein